MEPSNPHINKLRKVPCVGGEPIPGTLVEMIYRPDRAETAFAVSRAGNVEYVADLLTTDHRVLIPYSATNNLIRNRIILFPSEACEYNTEEALVTDIRTFIHRYVDVSELFELVTTYYVLLSWVY